MKRLTTLIALIAALPQLLCAQNLEAELHNLDSALELSEAFVSSRNERIAVIENMLQTHDFSPEQQFDIYGELYDAYDSYQFNKAAEALDHQMEIAKRLAKTTGGGFYKSRVIDVSLKRAMLYTVSGLYLEARVILSEELDTLAFSDAQRLQYEITQHRFHSDFIPYTNNPELRENSQQLMHYYRKRILEHTPAESEVHQQMVIADLFERGDFAQAEALNRQLMEQHTPQSHQYAIYAYSQARICEALEKEEEMVMWFARSAIADINNATKDNASLCSLAQALMRRNDIVRAFHYNKISLEDALFYNAKLRQWQIATVLPAIEDSYLHSQKMQEAKVKRYLLVISALAVALLAICLALCHSYHRTNVAQRKISQMNSRIKEQNESLSQINATLSCLNSELSEANTVKEEYIGLFLSMCSNYIDKLIDYQRNVKRKLSAGKVEELKREVSTNDLHNNEINTFYETFDNTFLQLYPTFVEDFNRLLKPEARIIVKKGLLNTELRIFALIRLGITDSSHIASLLRYSVNTIYNYRARTKNNAIGERDTFEEDIRAIGGIRGSH